MPDIMTLEQVADVLQLNSDTIYRLIRDKKLAASRIGRTYRITRDDVQVFLQANSTEPEVRPALFRQIMAIAERNPGVNSDDVLEELEELDRQTRTSPATKG